MTPLSDARDAEAFGGKAVQLGAAIRAGLPVPAGVALDTLTVEAIAAGEAWALSKIESLRATLAPRVAVRSSAVGEDGSAASFAGIHTTVLNVTSSAGLTDAIRQVHASAHAEAAIQYRRKKGISGPPRIGVVVQEMVEADRSGVMFTRCPVSGRDERVIEAAWGLGETIVAGIVTPDTYRIAKNGAILDMRAGLKDRMVVFDLHAGGTREEDVHPERHHALCLAADCLRRLHELAEACDRAFGSHAPHDIEWAFTGSRLHLLQRRPITTGANR